MSRILTAALITLSLITSPVSAEIQRPGNQQNQQIGQIVAALAGLGVLAYAVQKTRDDDKKKKKKRKEREQEDRAENERKTADQQSKEERTARQRKDDERRLTHYDRWDQRQRWDRRDSRDRWQRDWTPTVPEHCVVHTTTDERPPRIANARCLRMNGLTPDDLPRQCSDTFRTPNGPVRGYGLPCLRQNAVRISGRR